MRTPDYIHKVVGKRRAANQAGPGTRAPGSLPSLSVSEQLSSSCHALAEVGTDFALAFKLVYERCRLRKNLKRLGRHTLLVSLA